MSLPEGKLHEDIYVKFVKRIYFPALLKYHKYVLIGWLAAFVICIVYGPSFLSMTRNSLDLPSSAPSVQAINAFQEYFPNSGSQPPVVLLQKSTAKQSVINSCSKNFSLALKSFVSKEAQVSYVSGYWELISVTDKAIVAHESVSSDNMTMVTYVYFSKSATQDQVNAIATDLISFASTQTSINCGLDIYCTGLTPLFVEMTASTEASFLTIDATVIPIAIVILGANLQSYRHMLIAFCNLGCTLLLAFSLLVPVATVFSINPFAPSIMLSLGVAIGFDYSLFMLNRFREEVVLNRSSKEFAVMMCLAAAGHVVILSGCILLFTFILLITFPQTFLQSVGITCSCVIFTALLSNLTLTPSMLLCFDCFMKFEPFPTSQSFFCWVSSKASPLPNAKSSSKGIQLTSIPTKEDSFSDSPRDTDARAHEGADDLNSGYHNVYTGNVMSLPERSKRNSYFFMCPFWVIHHPFTALLIAAGVTAPLLWQVTRLAPTSDNNLIYLPGSRSLEGYNDLKKDFPIGATDPYVLLVSTDVPYSILSQDFFDLESKLVNEILLSYPSYLNSHSVTAVTYCNGQSVSYSYAVQYMNSSSPLYNTTAAANYRGLTNSLMNSYQTATQIRLETTVDPDSEAIVPFILALRDLIGTFFSSNSIHGISSHGYLFGGYTTTYDLQVIVYSLVPILVAVTIIAVMILIAVSFGSVMLTFRLVVTVGMSLIWTYGLAVTVYQPGPGQNAFANLTPSILNSTGIYWLIPIMSFSILIGLALDYDIFLMSRMVEFRRMGWSENMSTCLAVEKTGYIITTAGLIMSVSFAGLLIPKPIVLNQYGFSLFLGVAFDTFVIRTILMPAIVAIFKNNSRLFWWPITMPPIVLANYEIEKEAILAGYWSPDDYMNSQTTQS